MTHKWITGAAAAALVIAGAAGSLAMGLSPASASAATYRLAASGAGMQLTIGGHTLGAASSTVSAGSGAPVGAAGTGEFGPTQIESQHASAGAPGASQSETEKCAEKPPSTFPAPYSTAVTIEAACSSATASESATGMPDASASGSVSSLGVASLPTPSLPTPSLPTGTVGTASAPLRQLLPTVVTPGSSVASSLSGVLGTLPSLPQTGLPLATLVQKVAAATTGSTVSSLVTGDIGPSISTIDSSNGRLNVQSTNTGSTIELLVGAGAGGGALLTVDVGKATTSAHVDLENGKVTEGATVASVTLTVAPPAGAAQSFSLPPGASRSLFTGTPLHTTVSVSSPSTTSKKGTASAAGVELDLAQGTAASALGASGLTLVLGSSTSQASATAPTTPPSSTTTPTPTRSRPPSVPRHARHRAAHTAPSPVLTGTTTVHTGEPWAGPLPIALLSMSLLAGLGLLPRRHLLAWGSFVGRPAGRAARSAGMASRRSAGSG
ncbi:MAG: hypothetical protein ACRDXC_01540, partial [Acidimicrobiales bacterium]